MGGACILPQLAIHVRMQIQLATARSSDLQCNFYEQQIAVHVWHMCIFPSSFQAWALQLPHSVIDLGDITKHVQYKCSRNVI